MRSASEARLDRYPSAGFSLSGRPPPSDVITPSVERFSLRASTVTSVTNVAASLMAKRIPSEIVGREDGTWRTSALPPQAVLVVERNAAWGYGPSSGVRSVLSKATRLPCDDGLSPLAMSRTPASRSSSLNLLIAAIIAVYKGFGSKPISLSSAAFTNTITRIFVVRVRPTPRFGASEYQLGVLKIDSAVSVSLRKEAHAQTSERRIKKGGRVAATPSLWVLSRTLRSLILAGQEGGRKLRSRAFILWRAVAVATAAVSAA